MKVATAVASKVINEGAPMKIGDASLAAGSGWRDIDPNHIAELKADFTRGFFGVNMLSRPTIFRKHGGPATAADGNARISDGKHTLASLAELRQTYKAAVAADTDSPAVAGDD